MENDIDILQKKIKSVTRTKCFLERFLCIDTTSLQIGIALYSFLWGLWLFLVPNVFSLTNSFRYLKLWGGEYFWGSLLILISISIILSLKTNNLILKRLVDTFTFIVFGIILTSFIFAGSSTTIVAAFISQTIMSAWVLLASFSKG